MIQEKYILAKWMIDKVFLFYIIYKFINKSNLIWNF